MVDRLGFQVERVSMVITPNGAQVLARSAGIRPDHVVECRRAAYLLPPPPAERINTMPAALGLFRGETIDYILARAEHRANDIPLVEYLLLPSQMVRGMGGNLRAFSPYMRASVALEQRVEHPPLAFNSVTPPTAEAQTDDLLALINYCKGSLKTVSGLLAGLVQGMGLVITNAPRSLEQRLTFVQALLTLLPAPARAAITFATNVIDPAQTNPQIKFMTQPVTLDRHLNFDWNTGKLLHEVPEDPYTKFIMAQLRLDTSLVIEATDKLARTAVWRAMRRETMANALAWASKRASLDSAVKEGLPADRNLVAAVLAEDPTLPDDVRIMYARHLVRLSLALDNPEGTEIIPAMAVQNRELADAVYEQLWGASGGDKASAVYHMAETWITKAPMGVDVTRWRPLLGMAALARVNALLPGDPAKLVEYLNTFLNAPPVLQIESVIAQIIGLCRKRAYENADVARMLFLIGVTYLPLGGLQRLLADSQLMFQLPVQLRGALAVFAPQLREPVPTGALAKASEVFGASFQPIILARFVEWALTIPRLNLIDDLALRGMVQVAGSTHGRRFDTLIQHVIHDLSQLAVVRVISPASQAALIELSLARRQFDAAVAQMMFYQDMIYQSGSQDTLSKIVREAYRNVPLEPRATLLALESVQRSSLKPLFVASAELGGLEAQSWSAEMDSAMRHMTGILFNEPRLIPAIGVEPIMRLLQANSERRDVVESLRVAGALVTYMLTFSEGGPALLDRIYNLINWNDEVGEGALEVARNYIRSAPRDQASQVPRLLSKYGADVGTTLEATYRMHLIAGGPDFALFADKVRMAASLLIDIATFYFESRETPTIMKLRRNTDSMTGGLTDTERIRLSENLNRIGSQVLRLATLHNARNARRSRTDIDARRSALIKNRIAPLTALEATTWLSGFLGEGREVTLNLSREGSGLMMGARSVNILLRETDLIVELFDGMISAFAEDDQTDISRAAWVAEVEGLWGMVSLFKQREIRDPFVENAQLLPQVILHVAERGNERSLQASGVGKQLFIGKAQPKNVIDALRWISGYFAQEHRA